MTQITNQDWLKYVGLTKEAWSARITNVADKNRLVTQKEAEINRLKEAENRESWHNPQAGNVYAQIMEESIQAYIESIQTPTASTSKNTNAIAATNTAPPKISTPVSQDKIAEVQKKLVCIYPSSFNNYQHPVAPYVSVQFRTNFMVGNNGEASAINNDDIWEEIVFNPNTFFQSLSLEDNRGVKRLTLELVDQYYTTLENILMKCIFATQLSNKLSPQNKAGVGNFEFVYNAVSFINLRVRFGYTSPTKGTEEKFIDYPNDASFAKRAEEDSHKPVLKTPWIYFQILTVKQNMTDKGLKATISAISTSSSLINKAKLLQKFMIIKDTPRNIIEGANRTNGLMSVLERVSQGSITIKPFAKDNIEYYKQVETRPTEDILSQPPLVDNEIEISMGNKPRVDSNGNIIEEFKTVKEFLDSIMTAIPPLKIKGDGSLEVFKEGENSESTDRLSNYQYVIDETEKGSVIRFYYNNPDSFFQNSKSKIFLRTYFWRENAETVVQNLDIQTETDFAQMNMPLFTIGNNQNEIKIVYNSGSEIKEEFVNLGANGVQSSFLGAEGVNQNALLKNDQLDFSMVSQIMNVPGSADGDLNRGAQLITQKFLQNINGSVFRGSMTILGDPFFLFDKAVKPFEYLIKIMVLRPNAKMTNSYNEIEQQGGKSLSYVSGYYVITNIKHEINMNGYSTILEIMRWPSLFKTNTPPPSS